MITTDLSIYLQFARSYSGGYTSLQSYYTSKTTKHLTKATTQTYNL